MNDCNDFRNNLHLYIFNTDSTKSKEISEQIELCLTQFSERLEGQKDPRLRFFIGASFTLVRNTYHRLNYFLTITRQADVSLAPLIERFKILSTVKPLPPIPKRLDAWYNMVAQRDSIAKTKANPNHIISHYLYDLYSFYYRYYCDYLD